MTEWKTYKLGDIADIQTGPFGSQLHNKDYALVGSPIVTVEHLGNRHFTTQNLPLVSDTDKARLSKYILSEGDIVFSRVGSVDRCSYVSDKEVGWLFSGRCLRVRCNRDVYPLYIYYYFCLGSVKQYIRNVAVGATMPSINTQIMSEIPISLPSLEEQRRIAGILGAIDDKIENNRRINANLELQAQVLYKQWFVDNRSDDWVKIKLGEIIEISKKSITLSQFGNTIFEHYSLPAYDDGEQPTFDRGQDIKSSKFVIGHGMFLFSKLNPRIKRIWLPDIGTKHAICSTEFIPYKPKEEAMLGFCYSIVNSEHFYEYVLSLTNGSTGSHQRFHPIDTLEYSLYIPSESYIGTFEDLVMPMYKEILRNRKENRRLATLRDTLLPKLMNGEIKTE